jgi:hypothetical protein
LQQRPNAVMAGGGLRAGPMSPLAAPVGGASHFTMACRSDAICGQPPANNLEARRWKLEVKLELPWHGLCFVAELLSSAGTCAAYLYLFLYILSAALIPSSFIHSFELLLKNHITVYLCLITLLGHSNTKRPFTNGAPPPMTRSPLRPALGSTPSRGRGHRRTPPARVLGKPSVALPLLRALGATNSTGSLPPPLSRCCVTVRVNSHSQT